MGVSCRNRRTHCQIGRSIGPDVTHYAAPCIHFICVLLRCSELHNFYIAAIAYVIFAMRGIPGFGLLHFSPTIHLTQWFQQWWSGADIPCEPHVAAHNPDCESHVNEKQPIPYWIFTLGVINAIGGLSINMYLPGLTNIAQTLGTSAAMVQLTLASFFVGFAIGQLIYGPVSDRYGRKPLLQAGLGIFVLASLGCMLATDIHMLIALRFLQGLGACAGIVISRATVRDRLDTTASSRAYSIMMLISGVAPVLAPIAGSLMLEVTGWQGIFALLAGGGLLCIGFVQLAVSESVDRTKAAPLRIAGAAHTYALLLKDRQFLQYALCGGFIHAGVFAYVAASPALIINVFDVTPQFYGAVFGVNALAMIVVAQVNVRLVNRYPLILLLHRTTVFMAGSLVLLSCLHFLTEAKLPCLLLAFFIYVGAFGISAPNSVALALENQKVHAGSASALLGALHFCLSTISSTIVSAWHDDTALPVLSVMGGCCIASFLTVANARRRCNNGSLCGR